MTKKYYFTIRGDQKYGFSLYEGRSLDPRGNPDPIGLWYTGKNYKTKEEATTEMIKHSQSYILKLWKEDPNPWPFEGYEAIVIDSTEKGGK